MRSSAARGHFEPNEYTPDWLPGIVEKYLPQLRSEWGLDVVKMYSCGWFGCAFKTRLRRLFSGWGEFVLKFTIDDTEARNQILIMNLQRDALKRPVFDIEDFDAWTSNLPSLARYGFTIVESVARTEKVFVRHPEKTGMHPVFVILREEIQPLREKGPDFMKVGYQLQDYRDFARKWQEDPLPRTKGTLTERLRRELKETDLRDSIPSLSIQAGLTAFVHATGKPLADAHVANVGRRVQRGMADPSNPSRGMRDLVIFDPGYTRGVREYVRKLNPRSAP